MLPTPFLNLVPRRRSAEVSSAPDVDPSQVHCVQEYKMCMENIRREYPHLSAIQQQRMALEECHKMHEEEKRRARELDEEKARNKRSSAPEELIRGVMSRLNLGRECDHPDKDNNEWSGPDAGAGVACRRRSSATCPTASSTVASSKAPERSIAVQQSVRIGADQQAMLAQLDWNDVSDNDDSLQDSLDDIEAAAGCIKKAAPMAADYKPRPANTRRAGSTNRAIRSSLQFSHRRLSDFSALSDLEEIGEEAESGEESGGEDHAEAEDAREDTKAIREYHRNLLKKKDNSPSSELAPQEPVSASTDADIVLPDEIKVMLDARGSMTAGGKTDGNSLIASFPRRAGRGRGRGGPTCAFQSSYRSNAEDSHGSSFLSVDSANFQGDFSAWASFSSRSS